MNLKEKLAQIQVDIKAPKNLHNSFGNYNYRNAESIYEAVKPYLKQHNVTLLITDDVVTVGESHYVKATATLYDGESDDAISVSALAREAADKKGMDASQITGATSSYARKYALNGMFLLDDTKDTDTDEYKKEPETRGKRQAITRSKEPTIKDNEIQTVKNMCATDGIREAYLLESYSHKDLSELTLKEYDQIMRNWEVIKSKPNAHNS